MRTPNFHFWRLWDINTHTTVTFSIHYYVKHYRSERCFSVFRLSSRILQFSENEKRTKPGKVFHKKFFLTVSTRWVDYSMTVTYWMPFYSLKSMLFHCSTGIFCFTEIQIFGQEHCFHIFLLLSFIIFVLSTTPDHGVVNLLKYCRR